MMMFVLLVSLLIAVGSANANAVQQDAEYDQLMNNYGDTVDFLITDVNTYEVEWQKCSGDPHGQGAETPVDNNTLCWDFAGSQYGGRSIMLWEDVPNSVEVIGQLVARPNDQPGRPDLRTSMDKITINGISVNAFTIEIDQLGTHVETLTTDETYLWGETFDEDLYGVASISSSDGVTVEFAVDDYLYKIRMVSDYFSVTLVDGDVTGLDGICGQLHTYTTFSTSLPALNDHALAIANHLLFRPFLVTKTHHVGANKECWYYAQHGPIHGVFGNINDYLI